VADRDTELLADLKRDYRPRFLGYLTNRDEKGLTAAYDLGRASMQRGISLLDLVRVHHEMYVEVVASARDLAEAQGLARAGSAFLLEALAPFEMTQRGFMAGDGLERHRADGTDG
jgi:hypothetical protein